MAEAAEKKAPEAAAAPNPKAAAGAKPEGEKPKKKLDILSLSTIGLIAINLVCVVSMGLFVKKLTGRIGELQTQVSEMEKPEAPVEEEKEKSLGKEMAPPVQGTLYPMESFLVNISSDQGPKFLQTQMELELPDPGLEDEITRKKAALRDAIIVLLSSRSYKDLKEQGGLKKLRADILRSINGLLSTGKVREIYFTQFHFN